MRVFGGSLRDGNALCLVSSFVLLTCFVCDEIYAAQRPNIILVMADDQGWGETGYYQHPVLKTPHLDAMAAAGLRFDRFYAGGPVCSPTRASVITGRSHCRTGVQSHGYPLRLQEKTLAQALQAAGYSTGHFGKWHLNGLRGPGVPVLRDDPRTPGVFGFETWLSVTNFFDRDPLLSREGAFEEFAGDSSEIVVAEALDFIGQQAAADRPSFTVIWFGTPHSPFVASEEDRASFAGLDQASQNHYGELVAMDRAIGTLRAGLRRLEIADNTLVWYTSDNGGLPKISPGTVGVLRGFKGMLYEGGIRVPAIVEWPNQIESRVTSFPASALDILPTLAEIIGLPRDAWVEPLDGISLARVFKAEVADREKAIPFHYAGETALVNNQYKLLRLGKGKSAVRWELYDLASDPSEAKNLIESRPELATELKAATQVWLESLEVSVLGGDYPEKQVNPGEPEPRSWVDVDAYRKYFPEWKSRPEYKRVLNPN